MYRKSIVTLMAWTISMSLFNQGYCSVFLSQIPLQTLKQIYKYSINDGLALGILNGCIFLGGLLGSLFGNFFITRYSRRKNMINFNIVMLISGCIIYSPNFIVLIICRVIQGICIGIFSTLAPLIIYQLAPTEISGTLGIFSQFNIYLGVLIGFFFPYTLMKITGDQSAKSYWYYIFGLPQCIVIIHLIILLFIFPYETPKYLILEKRQKEAKELIGVIYLPQNIDKIYEQMIENYTIKQALNQTNAILVQPQEKQIVKPKTSTLAFLVSIHTALFQTFSGINMISNYATQISNQIADGQFGLVLPTLINAIQVIGLFISLYLFGKVGRRKNILFGSVIAFISNLLLTIGFFIHNESKIGLALIIIGSFMYMIDFGATLGPITFLYISQIVQPNLISFSMAINWLSSVIIIVTFPILFSNYLNNSPTYLFLFTTILCFCSTIINYLFVLETKDKNQKQINKSFQNYKICS